jgi:hypothetical protein
MVVILRCERDKSAFMRVFARPQRASKDDASRQKPAILRDGPAGLLRMTGFMRRGVFSHGFSFSRRGFTSEF